MRIEEFLREATAVPGLSGNEKEIADFTAAAFKEYCDEVSVTPLYSVVGRMKGSGPKIMFVAHLDEIGLMVTKIEKDGSLRIGSVGGVDPRILPGMRLQVLGKEALLGVVGAKAPHLSTEKEKKAAVSLDKLYVDLGLPYEKVLSLVHVGDLIRLEYRYTELLNNRVSVKACDDRACVAVLYRAMQLLKNRLHDADLYFVASSQEEVSSNGALTAGYQLNPDLAIVLDVCHADTPGAPKEDTLRPDSPSASMGPFVNPQLRARIKETALQENISLQESVSARRTYTDLDDLSLARAGIPCALLELPLKYMHTAVETLDLNAMNETARLLAAFAANAQAGWEELTWI